VFFIVRSLTFILPLTLASISFAASTNLKTFPESLQTYLNLHKNHEKQLGPAGTNSKGEIEILLEPSLIQQAQLAQSKRLTDKGWSEEKAQEATKVGIISEDTFWFFIRDAVRFPSGVLGLYNRIVWKHHLLDDHIGSIIMPYTSEGKIGLNINYRHATRSWMLELPRGGQAPNESALQCARRELLKETGWEAVEWELLTVVSPDSGVVSGQVSLYAAKVQNNKARELDHSEAIEQNMLFLTPTEIEKGFRKGGLWIMMRGHNQWFSLQDAQLGCALWLSQPLLQKQMQKSIAAL
jgi:ADP-ribose pyrophosphatase